MMPVQDATSPRTIVPSSLSIEPSHIGRYDIFFYFYKLLIFTTLIGTLEEANVCNFSDFLFFVTLLKYL